MSIMFNIFIIALFLGSNITLKHLFLSYVYASGILHNNAVSILFNNNIAQHIKVCIHKTIGKPFSDLLMYRRIINLHFPNSLKGILTSFTNFPYTLKKSNISPVQSPESSHNRSTQQIDESNNALKSRK